MKLLVVGAGATGAYYGAVAKRGGADVVLLARGPHGQAMRERGVVVRTPHGEFRVEPRVIASFAELGGETFDVVFVAVKMKDLAGVVPDAVSHVVAGGALITAQNGVEAEERVAGMVPAEQLVGGVLFIGASVAEPGVVVYRGMDTASLGAATDAAIPAAQAAAKSLAAAGVNAGYVANLAKTRWQKLVWNNAWNSLTALTRLPCATAARMPAVRAIAEASMREVVAVARAHGVDVSDGIVEAQLSAGEMVGDIQTSTLQDVLAGRRLEWDPLVGVIVRLGKRHGVPTPANELLAGLLEGLDAAIAAGR